LGNEKGSWDKIGVYSDTDNRFAYCDFINGGCWEKEHEGGVLDLWGAQVGFSHCKISGGKGTGIYTTSYAIGACRFTTFDNNVIEGFDNFPPVVFRGNETLGLIEKLDMTSDFSNNAKPYVAVQPVSTKDVSISRTTVPYLFLWPGLYVIEDYTLTINEGVTVYVDEDTDFHTWGAEEGIPGGLVINGTAANKVRITRLPGSTYHWGCFSWDNLIGSITHCIIEYGGKEGITGLNPTAMIYATHWGSMTLNHVEINHSAGYAAYFRGGWCPDITHTNVSFSGNAGVNIFANHGTVKPGCDNEDAIVLVTFP
jgi:hypothetical protein